mgnify:CR=1 FL=1|jgi:DnaJ-class molecular chaperone
MDHFIFAFDDRTICETCLTAEATRQDEVHGHDYCEGCWVDSTCTTCDGRGYEPTYFVHRPWMLCQKCNGVGR